MALYESPKSYVTLLPTAQTGDSLSLSETDNGALDAIRSVRLARAPAADTAWSTRRRTMAERRSRDTMAAPVCVLKYALTMVAFLRQP